MFTQLPLTDYIKKMAGTAFPSPKGGSALAVTGAMGAALISMCSQVSANRNPQEHRYQRLQQRADYLMNRFIELADEDTEAVYRMIQALRLGKDQPAHSASIKENMEEAAQALMAIGEHLQQLIELAEELEPVCATSCLMDLHMVQLIAKGARDGASRAAEATFRQAHEHHEGSN